MATRITTPTHSLEFKRRTVSRVAIGNDAATSTTMLAIGRLLFGGYFLYNGINHLVNQDRLSAYAASHAVPVPELAVAASGILLILGGLSLMLGLWPKVGAACIILFLIGVSPIMHDFWNVQAPQRMAEMVNFLKNIALIGGACFAAALPEPWPGRAGG
jgi:uncharacterized membrane protein YphA (DoxX/SURF4 family)